MERWWKVRNQQNLFNCLSKFSFWTFHAEWCKFGSRPRRWESFGIVWDSRWQPFGNFTNNLREDHATWMVFKVPAMYPPWGSLHPESVTSLQFSDPDIPGKLAYRRGVKGSKVKKSLLLWDIGYRHVNRLPYIEIFPPPTKNRLTRPSPFLEATASPGNGSKDFIFAVEAVWSIQFGVQGRFLMEPGLLLSWDDGNWDFSHKLEVGEKCKDRT